MSSNFFLRINTRLYPGGHPSSFNPLRPVKGNALTASGIRAQKLAGSIPVRGTETFFWACESLSSKQFTFKLPSCKSFHIYFCLFLYRTELAKYRHYKDGVLYEELDDLTAFDWKDMVTFYLGCSFSFEEIFERAGIHFPMMQEGKNVSMYITNVKCNASPPFSANLVVSMRSIKSDQLHAVFEATCKHDCAHGAPIHIGSPSVLGIKNIQDVDFGDPTNIEENEISVFWACGVTSSMAIRSAGKFFRCSVFNYNYNYYNNLFV